MMTRGAFIVLEGTDGSGTSTQLGLLANALRARGYSVEATNEPSRGPVGRLLRLLLIEGKSDPDLNWATMALLFAADRADHIARTVRPALEQGVVVVSDRYLLSSLIYQSLTADEGEAALVWIRELNRQAIEPDLSIVLDVSAATALERRQTRGGVEEIYEAAALQRRLAEAYVDARRFLPRGKLAHVDGSRSPEDVGVSVLEAVLGAGVLPRTEAGQP